MAGEKHDVAIIPRGLYCYEKNDKDNVCPYWSLKRERGKQKNGYCAFMEQGDWQFGGALWKRIKECGIKEEE
ncbi:MAG: hypothetical protein DDT19_00550 [Syntrophomonadaceae bacterium]|nr:hypothetical protein [Bacillota bacterium]